MARRNLILTCQVIKATLLSACILLACTINVDSAELYKWKDSNGILHYSDSPTDKAKLEKYNVEAITAIEYREPKAAKEITNKDTLEHGDVKPPLEVVNKPIVKKIKRTPIKKGGQRKGPANSYFKRSAERAKGLNYKRAPQRAKNLSRKHLPQKQTRTANYKNGNIKQYNAKVNKVNAKIIKENSIREKKNAARQREYQKKVAEVKRHNERVDRHNAEIEALNQKQRNQNSRGSQRSSIKNRKPYLGKGDPNRAFYQRHPAARQNQNHGGWVKTPWEKAADGMSHVEIYGYDRVKK